MTKRRCELFGHKWVPLFTKGRFKNIEVKFIGCYCKRCHYGYQDMLLTINKMTKMEYNMHSDKYFKEEQL